MINNNLYEEYKLSIDKFYEDARTHHGMSFMKLNIETGGHELGHYLSVSTEKDDKWSIDVSYQFRPEIYFSPADNWDKKTICYTTVRNDVERYSCKVIQHEDGSFTLNHKKFATEAELFDEVKHLVETEEVHFERRSERLDWEESSPRLTHFEIV